MLPKHARLPGEGLPALIAPPKYDSRFIRLLYVTWHWLTPARRLRVNEFLHFNCTDQHDPVEHDGAALQAPLAALKVPPMHVQNAELQLWSPASAMGAALVFIKACIQASQVGSPETYTPVGTAGEVSEQM